MTMTNAVAQLSSWDSIGHHWPQKLWPTKWKDSNVRGVIIIINTNHTYLDLVQFLKVPEQHRVDVLYAENRLTHHQSEILLWSSANLQHNNTTAMSYISVTRHSYCRHDCKLWSLLAISRTFDICQNQGHQELPFGNPRESSIPKIPAGNSRECLNSRREFPVISKIVFYLSDLLNGHCHRNSFSIIFRI